MKVLRVHICKFLLLLLVAMYLFSINLKAEDGFPTMIYFDGLPYVGMFYGESNSSDSLEGKGTFIVDDSSEIGFEIKGQWNNGLLNGATEITYEDGSVTKVKYKNNNPVGTAVQYFTDGSYMNYRYEKGVPVGRILHFNNENEIIGIDRFFDGKRISEWCLLANELPYREVMMDPKSYKNEPVFFNGTVTDVWESDSLVYLVIKDQIMITWL